MTPERRASRLPDVLSGMSVLKFAEVVLTARALHVTMEDLLDETYLKQDEELIGEMQTSSPHSTPTVCTRPRYLVMPSNNELCPGCDSNARHLL